MYGPIHNKVQGMWLHFKGLHPKISYLSSSQQVALDKFAEYFKSFLLEYISPDENFEITDKIKSHFTQCYCLYLQAIKLSKVVGKMTVFDNVAIDRAREKALAVPLGEPGIGHPGTATKLGSIKLFPNCAPSQPPITTLNTSPPPLPTQPMEPDVPWTIIGEKGKNCNKPHSFAAAASRPTQALITSHPSSVLQTTNCPQDLSDQ